VQRVAVINVVGLSPSLLQGLPRLAARARRDGLQAFRPAFPAVTCSAQATYLTGIPVAGHGVVGNGWHDRESAETRFWKQSNQIVRGAKIWDALRRELPGATCANLFWWFNMHSSVDWAITPRPLYPADGRKVFDVHTQPMGMREQLKAALGEFPFPAFWGPRAGIASSEWIAASARWTEEQHRPDLTLVYLPHLDYSLQKFGPGAPETPAELAAIDQLADDLAAFLEARGVRVLLLSEYGISKVSRPVHLNRLFRRNDWLAIKDELGRDALIAGDSAVFAVPDHQVAQVYVRNPALLAAARELLENTPGVERVLAAAELWAPGPARERGGDLVAIAAPDAWFGYHFWDDDKRAPDYARTVDIHRKPGYDPAELFIDPALRFPRAKLAKFLLKKKLGLRGLLEVVPLDGSLVRGSHGRDQVPDGERPLVIGAPGPVAHAEDIFPTILAAVRG
jgi:predicted AlkP superfamily pyrophosphatase or phosphodiesterase